MQVDESSLGQILPDIPTKTTVSANATVAPKAKSNVRAVSASSLTATVHPQKKVVSFDHSDSSTSKPRKTSKKKSKGKPKIKLPRIPANATCIDMRTGTLILHRGPGKRRAEFIFKL